MKYIQAKDGVFLRQIDSSGDIFWDINHNCPVRKLTSDEIVFFEVYPLTITITPPYDVITQRLSETDGS